MNHLKPVFAIALMMVSLAANAESSSSGGSSSSKGRNFLDRADKREAKRWTLQEWLEQRDRNRMMDLWLSLNSPSPYEIMAAVSHNGYTTEITGGGTPVQYTSYVGEFSAYAQIVGLTAEYENNTEEKYNDLNGLLNLRLFGESIQSSYFAVHYGLRTHAMSSPEARLSQHMAQVSLQLYAMKAFGIDGKYRIYYPSEVNTAGIGPSEYSGSLLEAGAFIDFKNFRVFGDWYKENTSNKATGLTTDSVRTGVKTGLKIFF